MTWNEKLKELRLNARLTQIELAAKINRNKVTISNYEAGLKTPPREIFIKLAEIFGVSLDYLTGRPQFNISIENFTRHIEIFFMDDSIPAEEKELALKNVMKYYFESKEVKRKKEN